MGVQAHELAAGHTNWPADAGMQDSIACKTLGTASFALSTR